MSRNFIKLQTAPLIAAADIVQLKCFFSFLLVYLSEFFISVAVFELLSSLCVSDYGHYVSAVCKNRIFNIILAVI